MTADTTKTEVSEPMDGYVPHPDFGASVFYTPATNVLSVKRGPFLGFSPRAEIKRFVRAYVCKITGDIKFETQPLRNFNDANGQWEFQLSDLTCCYEAYSLKSNYTRFFFYVKNGELKICNRSDILDLFPDASEIRAASIAREEEIQLEKEVREVAANERARELAARKIVESERRAEFEVEIESRLVEYAGMVSQRREEPIGDTAVSVFFNRDRASKNFAKARLEISMAFAPELEKFVEYKAGQIIADSRAELTLVLAAKTAIGGKKLVALTGSPAQIAWAQKIRARVMTKMPAVDFDKIAKSSKAKFWIDNFKDSYK
jgi:hypothetical protein